MHENHKPVSGHRFSLVTGLNLAITLVEILGGLFSGSLALLSDAFHNLGDCLSIVLSYFAQAIGKKDRSSQKTFGYKRAEILAAFINGTLLVILSLILIVEAIKRFNHPQTIDGPVMLTVAIVGLLANLLSAGLLNTGSHDNLNIKTVYLHVLSDALSSIAVILAGLVLTFVDLPWLDPLLTILVAIYIAYEALPINQKTVGILMQGAPNLDYQAIKEDILQIPSVVSVHHIHAWMVDEHEIIFSAHINMTNCSLDKAEVVYSQIEKLLKDKYAFNHTTIQAECHRGLDEGLFDTNKK